MTTPLQRIRSGDWQTALTAAAAGLLAAIVAAQVVATSWLLVPEDDLPLTAGLWLRFVAGLVGAAFWSPVVMEYGEEDFSGGTSATLAPLSVTLAALGALYVVLRRAARSDGAGAWEHALRAAAPFAIGVALVCGIFGRVSPEPGIQIRTGWMEALLFALLAATATAMLAYRDLWKPFPENVTGLGENWWGPARVAAYALGVGTALSGAAALVLMFVHADEAEQGAVEVLALVPAFLGVVVNAGIALFSVASGGRAGVTAGPTDYVALYRLHDLSPLHWLLVLIPIVTVVLTVRWAARRGGVSWPRVIAILVPAWIVLAWASSPRFTFGFGGLGAQTRAGASILWGALALAVWFGLVAAFVGPSLTGDVSPTEPMVPQRAPRREAGPSHVLVATLAVLVVLWAACGAVVAEVRGTDPRERIDQQYAEP